jgi:dipeptidyl aminopeptidase/acylaminoacyl peptidase
MSFMRMSLLSAICLSALVAQESPKAWTPELSMRLRQIPSVRPAPDGKRVAFAVTEAVMTPEKSEYLTQIHLALGDGHTRQLTFGDKSSSQPAWSADGKALAFLSSRSGKNQLYVMPLDGGEGEPITDMKSDISAFAWAPDGKSIAFVMSDAKSDDEEKKAKSKDDSRFFEEHISHARLYVVKVDKDSNGKREPKKLTPDARSVQSFDWSPDAKSIVFSHTKSSKADHWTSADISVVDAESGKTRVLANTSAAENTPFWSRDGKWIACSISDNPPRWAQHFRLALIPAEGGAAKFLAESPDGSPTLLGWMSDSKTLIYSEPRGTLVTLYQQGVDGSSPVQLATGSTVSAAISLDPKGTQLGLAMQSKDRAVEAFATPLNAFAPRQISHVNADLPTLPLPRTEVITWKATDGRDIEGILTYPTDYKAGAKVPLILNVHGGPAGVFAQTFNAAPQLYPIAAFAAKGMAILRPNPRGSSGYGVAFRRANEKDWGGEDYRDLMRGVDKVLDMGVADANRLGVMGWSYGGFMSSWIITQTDRFKAASIGAPVTNLMSFNGTTDIPAFVPDYFGGQSWEVPEVYARFGAMNHIGKAKTPALIQHCEGDLRVPISQGYELHNALKQRGIETRMLVIPRQAHGPTEPKALLKVMQSNLAWFEEKLKP